MGLERRGEEMYVAGGRGVLYHGLGRTIEERVVRLLEVRSQLLAREFES